MQLTTNNQNQFIRATNIDDALNQGIHPTLFLTASQYIEVTTAMSDSGLLPSNNTDTSGCVVVTGNGNTVITGGSGNTGGVGTGSGNGNGNDNGGNDPSPTEPEDDAQNNMKIEQFYMTLSQLQNDQTKVWSEELTLSVQKNLSNFGVIQLKHNR
jgi:hypothetical protein